MDKHLSSENILFEGKKIRALREYLGLSRGEFGAKIGYSNSHVGRIENGTSGIKESTINNICQVFHVNPKFFFSNEESLKTAVSRDEFDDIDVGRRLKKEREKNNYTQAYLADISGTSQALVSLVEKNKKVLTSKQAEKLASALGVGTEYLLTGNLKKKDNPVNRDMIEWLWNHPEERKAIWKKIQDENG